MCLFDSATCWRIGRKRCSPDTRLTVLWSAWSPTSGCSGPPWWPGGKSEERVTASADAVRSFLTDRPSHSLPRVASRIRLGSVSSMNCTSGSMSSANRTGLCMISLLSFHSERVSPESYRVAGSCAAILSARKRPWDRPRQRHLGWHRPLGRPASESGRLRHGDGGPRTGRPPPEGATVAYAQCGELACGLVVTLLERVLGRRWAHCGTVPCRGALRNARCRLYARALDVRRISQRRLG